MYGPKVAALGIRGKAQSHTAIAMSKDLICQGTMSKRQLPPGVLLGPLYLHLKTMHVLSPSNPPRHPQAGCCMAVGLEYGCTK